MKKVSLLSLLAVLAVSTAAQANVEDPLYAPAEGKFYSKTAVNKAKSVYNVSEEIGYGISNKFAIAGGIDYQNDTDTDADGFDTYTIGGKYKISNGFIVYADYTGTIDEDKFVDVSIIDVGALFGKQTAKYTLAGKIELDHVDSDVADSNNVVLGAKGAYNFDDRVSGSLGLDYTFLEDKDDDSLVLTAQINYQKGGLWSLYYSTELIADGEDDSIGLKYGIQF